ncbi:MULTISPECIES: type VII secretion protein EccB [unclassified Streptomyces]|uniref:type VII secretion protein EccB n=1 Tax=unclassified Streptomyces TaxID=2593676 RepID=UPI000DC77828|nr:MULTISPECIES: type VII secretion protein EccB [unclassified Streptomyces]AWZ05309.1 type VII secretion protein EccB [Streptomyces sp. ICC4]AWZ11443.1 type VII secretion protein EccB [Streptomyces sp. ICC1]
MQSRKDQVQAHMFVMGRLTSGMLRQDPDAPESPVGRTNRGLAWGIGLGVVLVVGFVLFGLLSPAGTKSWRTANALIVEKDTGTRYLYLDGRLHPVRNYASARLMSENRLSTVTVSSASLRGEPHGTPVGIPGAPDSLPEPGDLEKGSWQVCADEPRQTGPDGTGRTARTSLRLGFASDGEAPGNQRALLVAGPDGVRHVLWGDRRLRIGGHGAQQALGYSGAVPTAVSAAFLDSLPAGADLAAPEIEGRGTDAGTVGGAAARVGQVFTLSSPGTAQQYFLLEAAGLRPLSALAAALVLGDDRTAGQAYPGRVPAALALSADELTRRQAPAGQGGSDPADWPAGAPAALALTAGSQLCAQIQPEGTAPRIRIALVREAGRVPDPAAGPEIARACLPVDGIAVRPGGGALVQALGAGGGVRGTTTYLVTDVGVKYRLPDAAAVERLGLKGGHAQAVPSRLLDMLPTGPRLDVDTAMGRQPAAGAGGLKPADSPCE